MTGPDLFDQAYTVHQATVYARTAEPPPPVTKLAVAVNYCMRTGRQLSDAAYSSKGGVPLITFRPVLTPEQAEVLSYARLWRH